MPPKLPILKIKITEDSVILVKGIKVHINKGIKPIIIAGTISVTVYRNFDVGVHGIILIPAGDQNISATPTFGKHIACKNSCIIKKV